MAIVTYPYIPYIGMYGYWNDPNLYSFAFGNCMMYIEMRACAKS